jgi:hypothetical protein
LSLMGDDCVPHLLVVVWGDYWIQGVVLLYFNYFGNSQGL